MKKIGFVIPWFGDGIPGGAEMELRETAKHLQAAGAEVEILATCVKEFSADWNVNYYPEGPAEAEGLPIRRFKIRKRDTATFDAINLKFMTNQPVSQEEERVFLKEMVNSPDLYKYIAEKKEDYSFFVYIPYMFGTTYYGIQACPEKAVMIPCLHDESYAYMNSFKEAFKKVKGMIFHARPEKELAERLYDLSNVHTGLLGEGVNMDTEGDAECFRKKYNIREPFIMYAGRKDAGKKVDLLLEYFAEYKKRNKNDVKLILIGGGEIAIPESVRSEVYDFGFVPKQDKYDAYAAAMMLCQPSWNESFSLVIMESWLAGRPVLVSKKCNVTRNFVHETNGGLYFDSYPEFEGCVNYMINHPDIADVMGENGNSYVRSNFAWDVIIQRFIKFLEELQ